MTTEEILALKPEADKIMAIPGNTKGNSFKTDADFIRKKEGEDGLSELEEALALLGYPVTYDSLSAFDWHPEAQAVLGIYVASKIFDWDENDLFDMGYAAPATSLLVKMMMSFVSAEATFNQAPAVWGKHYDFGSLETVSFDKEARRLTFRIRDYPFFKYMDSYFDGFNTKTLELVIVPEDLKIERRVCPDDPEQCRIYTGLW